MRVSHLSCLLIVFVLAFPCLLEAEEAEPAPSEELWWTPFVEHLEFFGYKTEVSEDVILALIEPGHNIALERSGLGVLVTTFYINDSGRAYDCDLHKAINTVNSQAVLSRTYLAADDSFFIEGFYAAEYDRTRFGGFLQQLLSEMTDVLAGWREWAFAETPPSE